MGRRKDAEEEESWKGLFRISPYLTGEKLHQLPEPQPDYRSSRITAALAAG